LFCPVRVDIRITLIILSPGEVITTRQIAISLKKELVRQIDFERGDVSRSRYIQRLIELALDRSRSSYP